MKKGLAFLLALLTLGSLAWAQASFEIGPDGKSIVFIYDAPEATTVTIRGTFNGWAPAPTPLVKGEDGKWRITIPVANENEEIVFKFLVDDEYDENVEPYALATKSNPFGSLDAIVSIALIKQKSGGSVAGSKIGLRFGSYQALGWQSIFKTEGDNPTVKGIALSENNIFWKWYPKFQGYGTEWLWIFTELAVADFVVPLLKRGTGDQMEVSGFEGINYVLEGFGFSPFYNYNQKKLKDINNNNQDIPGAILGNLQVRLELPYTHVKVGYFWAKVTDQSPIYFNLRKEHNASKGIIEIASNAPLPIADDVKLSYVVAPNRSEVVGGNYGLYSWVTLDLLKIYTINLHYAFKSGIGNNPGDYLKLDDIWYYNPQNQLALGVKLKPIEGLTVDAEGMLGFRFKNYLTSNELVDLHDTFAGAIKVAYEMPKVFGVSVVIRNEGDDSGATNIYGKDMMPGKYYFELNPYVFVPDVAKIGIDTNYKLDNQFDEAADINMFFKPYANINLGSVVPTLNVNLYAKLILDLIGIDKLVGFKLEEVNLETKWENLTIDLTLFNEYFPVYDDSVKAYPLPFSYIYLIGTYNLGSDLGVIDSGIRFRIPGADATENQKKLNNLFGIFAGYSVGIKNYDLRNPLFWVKVHYNFNMWKDFDKPDLNFSGDGGRPDVINGGSGQALFSFGLMWDL